MTWLREAPRLLCHLAAAPEHLVAEIIDGELVTHPRPCPRHSLAMVALGRELSGPCSVDPVGPAAGFSCRAGTAPGRKHLRPRSGSLEAGAVDRASRRAFMICRAIGLAKSSPSTESGIVSQAAHLCGGGIGLLGSSILGRGSSRLSAWRRSWLLLGTISGTRSQAPAFPGDVVPALRALATRSLPHRTPGSLRWPTPNFTSLPPRPTPRRRRHEILRAAIIERSRERRHAALLRRSLHLGHPAGRSCPSCLSHLCDRDGAFRRRGHGPHRRGSAGRTRQSHGPRSNERRTLSRRGTSVHARSTS